MCIIHVCIIPTCSLLHCGTSLTPEPGAHDSRRSVDSADQDLSCLYFSQTSRDGAGISAVVLTSKSLISVNTAIKGNRPRYENVSQQFIHGLILSLIINH